MREFFNIFGNYSEKEVKRLLPTVEKIKNLDDTMSKLSDEELRGKTEEFKTRLKNGETLDDITVEAFAVVREAAFRTLGMKHYDVQIIGGLVLHQGRVAEMKTGEGKTLVGTLPAYLNALEGKGVHIITSNEYLAQRDCEEMGQVHRFLGLTVDVILNSMEKEDRRKAYSCDITYGTNSEIGFDYLKDNMVMSREERVQRGLNYVIVDEIDSILVDEARTPLIISGGEEETSDYYIDIQDFIVKFKKDEDYEFDEKKKAVTLTNLGISKIEKHFKIDNYGDLENVKLQHHITQALKANFAMIKDIDYIENEDEEIMIVDTFTGRVMDGRRFSDGLHQAIEAKEDVEIQPQTKTLATITLQNLFRMYKKLSGMSGTVLTEENEFRDVYSVDVIAIPTNRPVQRIDREDLVYKTLEEKYIAIANDIEQCYKRGQSVLVGTASIQKSEDISAILKRRNIPHKVLNAKNHKNEAAIVEKAGEKYAITIATNMAGRGTDIKLTSESEALGGLKVIGTERHESVRIDNQLRGRAGRQGDVGESLFYVSLDDDMMKNYISDKYRKILGKLDLVDNEPIGFKSINKVVEQAQKSVEGDNFAARKDVVGYDDVLDKQRKIIYEQRNHILDEENLDEVIEKMVKHCSDTICDLYFSQKDGMEIDEEYLEMISLLDIDTKELKDINKKNISDIKEKTFKVISEKLKKLFGDSDSEEIARVERVSILEAVDKHWIEYLSEVEYLKLGIGLRSVKQQDPVLAFKMEASDMFIKATETIKEDSIKRLFDKLKNGEKKEALDLI